MNEKIIFDTLKYTESLQAQGIMHAEAHAAALREIFTQNMYTKTEVDAMLEDAMRQFDMTIKRLDEHNRNAEHKMQMEIRDIRHEMRLDLEKRFQRNLITTITVLGGMFVLFSGVNTLMQYLLR